MKRILKIGIILNITAFVAVMLFSCSNPDAIVQAMGSDDTLSGIIADSVVFYRSDSGVINLELHTPRMVRMETEDDIMEFPLGFDVYMYDKGEKTTELHADYGKDYGKMRLIEAQGNVIVQNFGSNETMYSDKLFWYQDTKMIYTRSHVKIVTPDKQIEADSLVAREDFSEYTMYSGSALLDVDEED
ncbi:MAG: LPS export ABC transporter periplasmic protein LptC [Bacteroidales bacterium]|nr:LPS export ABC transporter periplasmic protein LptC [Bacteroidales bacterium]